MGRYASNCVEFAKVLFVLSGHYMLLWCVTMTLGGVNAERYVERHCHAINLKAITYQDANRNISHHKSDTS